MNNPHMNEDRLRGTLWGQAVGNALGILTEFTTKKQVEGLYPGGLVSYKDDLGVWEDDDTNQMLCLLDEIVDNGSIEARSLARRLLHWLETDGRGCGNLVYQVLTHRNFLTDPMGAARDRWELHHRDNAPNGAVMRTSVVGLLPNDCVANAETAAKVTHVDPRCVGSAVIVSEIIHALVWENKELSYDEISKIGRRYDHRLQEWIDLAHGGTIEQLQLDEPGSIGYTLKTLGVALWCYFHAPDFQSGLLAVVNEGGDADTNAAVACAVLGAKFGLSGIPAYWIDNLDNREPYAEKVQALFTAVSVPQND